MEVIYDNGTLKTQLYVVNREDSHLIVFNKPLGEMGVAEIVAAETNRDYNFSVGS